MKTLNKNQSGFSVIEIFVATAIVAVIGIVGWFVYQNNRTQPTDAAQNNGQATPQSNKTDQEANNVIKIPELGIQITVPDSIKDLTYETNGIVVRNGSRGTAAFFTTRSLMASAPDCTLADVSFQSLARVAGQYPSADEYESVELDFGFLAKQFPDFYISTGYPNTSCPSGVDTGKLKNDFSQALTTIQETK